MSESQLTLFDDNAEYDAFTDKFVPKKTTDDCYTPANIYRAVARWVAEEYGLDETRFLRPFKPGGDYEREEYPDGCVVVDNPPFSILKQIVQFYNRGGVPFFLFCPALNPPKSDDVTIVAVGCHITYENGADICTSFVTNLQSEIALRTAPTLYSSVKAENAKNLAMVKRHAPKYEYPKYVITPALAQKYGQYGVDLAIARSDAMIIKTLDAMKAAGKKSGIFGHGYLLSERAAAAAAAAQKAAEAQAASASECAAAAGPEMVWELSEREKRLVASLGKEESP